MAWGFLGAIALFKVSTMLGGRVDLDEDPNARPTDETNPTTKPNEELS